MKTIHDLLEIPRNQDSFPGIGLTIGNFDGVHVGHRQLLSRIKKDCENKGLRFVVMTFLPHPQKILQPEKAHFLINSYERRRELLEGLGVDYLVELAFTRDFSTLSPELFLKRYMFTYPELREFYLGYDFAFGANKRGGFDLVKSICLSHGIEAEVQPKFEHHGKVVSSSYIRENLLQGKIPEVNEMLNRPFQLEGVVIKGEGRGKKIGYPTANIQVSPDLMIPEKGVYVTRTTYNGMTFQSVTNIGHNPTFKDTQQLHIETNIFDFETDIYGEKIELQFFAKLRDEKKFPTVNDLISQIRQDAQAARSYLKP